MSEDVLTTIAKRAESLRKIITNVIWIAIVVVVLAAVGRFLVVTDAPKPIASPQAPRTIPQSIPWNEVDKAVASAMSDARKSAEVFASQQLDVWVADLMTRVDPDFLDWYFSYWTQQKLGLEGLWQYGVKYFFESQPSAAEKLTEKIQQEFSKRVLRPQIAELALERIVRGTATVYMDRLRTNLSSVPTTYKIPSAEWDKYVEGIALTTIGADGNRETPVTLKALTASSAGGAVLIAGKMKVLVAKLSSKVMAKSAGKVASNMAIKTGEKVVAKAGRKFLGTIVGIGVLVWDVWDHNQTVAVNRPILRKAIADYFAELKVSLLTDADAGIMATFNDLERQVVAVNRQQEKTAQ